MKLGLFIFVLTSLLYGCSSGSSGVSYELSILDIDSNPLAFNSVVAYGPVEKTMNGGLLFNPYSDTSKFVITRDFTRKDTFFVIHKMSIVEDEVVFSDFKFHSNTIKKHQFFKADNYTSTSPFLKVFLTP